MIYLLKEYKTVLNEASAEYEEKKSRFIASVMPVKDEDDATAFINSLRSRCWDASHNVYAYHIGGNSTVQRYSDDGEPSGTAGMPVLEVIRRMGLQYIVVVVTRYFGGTLLGAAGLIRAYTKSAALGIEAAVVVKKLLCCQVALIMEYTLFGKVQNILLTGGYTIKSVEYQQDVEIVVYIPVDEVEAFAEMINDTTNTRVLVDIRDKCYITVDENGKLIKE